MNSSRPRDATLPFASCTSEFWEGRSPSDGEGSTKKASTNHPHSQSNTALAGEFVNKIGKEELESYELMLPQLQDAKENIMRDAKERPNDDRVATLLAAVDKQVNKMTTLRDEARQRAESFRIIRTESGWGR